MRLLRWQQVAVQDPVEGVGEPFHLDEKAPGIDGREYRTRDSTDPVIAKTSAVGGTEVLHPQIDAAVEVARSHVHESGDLSGRARRR